MRYVVTGAAGFIGSNLAEQLVAAGHEVVGVDCFTDYYDPAEKEKNARGLDVRRLDLAEETLDLDGVDGVFHLAGQPGVRSFGDVFPVYVRRNVLATQRVFEAAAAAGVRVVFASSSSVYGEAEAYPTPRGRRAAADLAVRDHEARLRASRARVRERLRSRCGRAPLLHGVRAAAAARHVLPARLRCARRGRRVRDLRRRDAVAQLHRGRRRRRRDDRGHGARRPQAPSSTSAGATRRRCSRRSRSSSRRRAARSASPVDAAKGDVARTKADVTRIREALGWEPRTTLERGSARMWSWASGRVAAG